MPISKETFTHPPEGESFLKEQKDFQDLLKHVESALNRAAIGNDGIKKLLADKEFKKDMEALLDYQKGRGVRWFREGQIDLANDEKFKEADRKQMELLGKQAEDLVLKYFDLLEKNSKKIKDSVANHKAAEGSAPLLSGGEKVLKQVTGNVETLRLRQRAMHKIAQELIRNNGASLSKADTKTLVENYFAGGALTAEEKKSVEGLDTKIIAALPDVLNDDGVKKLLKLLDEESRLPPVEFSSIRNVEYDPKFGFADLIHAIETLGKTPGSKKDDAIKKIDDFYKDLTVAERKLLIDDFPTYVKGFATEVGGKFEETSARELILAIQGSVIDRHSMKFAQRAASKELIELGAREDRHIVSRFPEREVYLYRLAGTKPKQLIERCKREDGKLEVETMNTILKSLKLKEIDPAKLDFSAFDDKKVAELSDKYHLKPDGLKECAKLILTEGSYAIPTTGVYAWGASRNYGKTLEALYGTDIAKDVKDHVPGGAPDPMDAYFRQHYSHAVLSKKVALDLTSAWKSNAFEEYLKKDIKFDNPAGIDAAEALRRMGLSADLIKHVKDNELETSMGTLYELAGIEELLKEPFAAPDDQVAAQKIAALVVDADKMLKKEKLEEIGAFFLFRRAGAAKTKATADGKAWAQEVIDTLKGKTPPAVTITGADIKVNSQAELVATIKGKLTGAEFEAARKNVVELSKSGILERTLAKNVKVNAREFARLLTVAGKDWGAAMLALPRNVTDPRGDTDLEKLLNQERALKGYRSAFTSILSHFDAHEEGTAKSFDALRKGDLASRLAKKRSTEFITLPESLRMKEMADRFVAKQKFIHDRLSPLWAKYKDPKVRQTALFIANQVPSDESLALAMKYLENPVTFDLAKELKPEVFEELNGFYAKRDRIEMAEGSNVLTPGEKELHIRMQPHALLLLEKHKLLDGDAHFDKWLANPASAAAPLELILEDIRDKDGDTMGGKKALINAFCKGAPAPYSLPDGTTKNLNFGDAQIYVAGFQRRLQVLREDRLQSELQLGHAERSKNPLDYLRSGAKELGRMLKSRDKVEKALALTMILAGGYFLWQTWKKGGLGKNLMIGLPLFFGADIVVKRMTGKGVLERLGLTYMNAKDRNTALEQFYRRHEKHPEYGEVSGAAGQEAVKQLMNPKDPVSMKDLLEWRAKARSGRTGAKFSTGAPKKVQEAASSVASKIGSIEKVDRDERAYEIMLKVVEAVCIDVATANKQPATVENGIKLINERWIKMDAPYLAAFKDDLLEVAGGQPGGGFSLLTILTIERPTPAMQNELIENETFLEWVLRGTGITLKEAKEKLKDGMALAGLLLEHGKNKVPGALAYAKDKATKASESMYKWLRLTTKKSYEELSAEAKAAWDLTVKTLTAAGIFAYEKAPGVFDWSVDATFATVEFTIDSAQNAYRQFQLLGITGEPLDAFDRLVSSIFPGITISKYVFYKDTIKTNDEHVEKRAEFDEWKKEFIELLGSIATPPAEAQVNSWVLQTYANQMKISPAVSSTAEFNGTGKVPIHTRMAVYEGVKRHAYSFLLAQRIRAIQSLPAGAKLTYPIKPDVKWSEMDLSKENPLAKDPLAAAIERSYDPKILLLLGLEKTRFVGAYYEWVRSWNPGMVRSVLQGLHSLATIINRDASNEYVKAIDEYMNQFIAEAEQELRLDPDKDEKLKLYKSYLNTVLTNAVIDMTLSSRGPGGLPADRASSKEMDPMILAVREAQNFLEYLRYSRGSSAEPKKFKNFNIFKDFTITEGKEPELEKLFEDEKEMLKIQRAEPMGEPLPMALPGVPSTIPPAPSAAVALLSSDDAPKDASEEAALFAAIGTNLQPGQKATLQIKLDKGTSALPNTLGDPATRQRYLNYMRGASAGTRETLMNKMLEHYKNNKAKDYSELMNEALAMRGRDATPEGRKNLQQMIDKSVGLELKKVFDEVAKIKIDDTAALRTWEPRLLELYKATSATNPGDKPDRTSDLVSYLLEYVLYQEKNEDVPDLTTGKKGFKKYEAYLNSAGLTPPQDTKYSYGAAPTMSWVYSNKYDGSRVRMDSTYKRVNEGILKANSGPGDRLNKLLSDLKIDTYK